MIRSYPFWLATAVGVAIGIYIFFVYIQKKEGFAVGTSQTSCKPPSKSASECPAGKLVEDTKKMPYEAQLKTYISSFSDGIKGIARAPYCASTLRWYDLKTPDNYFVLKSPTPPSSILGTGLPLKNVILTGPPSNMLLNDSTGSLGSFTVFFYATLAIPVLSNRDTITMLNFYANTPDMIKLVLKRSNLNNHVRVQLILGKWQNRYTWDIPTPTFISNGNPSLYAITFDAAKNQAVFYIGNIPFTASIKIDADKKIKLSNTQMEINSEGNLDATLFSFGVMSSKLTDADIKSLGSYMYKMHANTEKMIAEKEDDTKTTTVVQQANINASISSINKQLKENKDLIINLQSKKPATAAPVTQNKVEPKKAERNWTVQLPPPKLINVEGFAVKEPTPQTAYKIVYPVADMLPAVKTKTILENTSLTRLAKKNEEADAAEKDKIKATPKGIEPPYYDETLSTKYPMPLDASQGWIYQN